MSTLSDEIVARFVKLERRVAALERAIKPEAQERPVRWDLLP
jgi:hypothetical protein